MNELAGEIYAWVFGVAGIALLLVVGAMVLGVVLILRTFQKKGR